jgi:hypothetical protein
MKNSYLLLRNSSVLETDALGGPQKHVQIFRLQAVSECISTNLQPKSIVQGHFMGAVGHNLRTWKSKTFVYVVNIHLVYSFQTSIGKQFLIPSGYVFLFTYRIKELLALGFWKKIK